MSPWRNQYIDLVATKPERIFRLEKAEQAAYVRELLAHKTCAFEGTIVEIGSGSGGHLLDRAAASPRLFFVGFELRYKRVWRTAQKGEQRGLTNFAVVQGDARFLPELFDPGSLSGVYVNFPDPWDKRRWDKHRLLTATFLETIFAMLKPEAFFAYRSDHERHFVHIVELLSKMPEAKIEKLTHDFWKSAYSVDNISSEFEKLFKGKGVPVHYLLTKKIGPQGFSM